MGGGAWARGGGGNIIVCVHSKLNLYVHVSWYIPCLHTGASAGYHCAILFTNTHVRVLTSSMT